MTNETIRVLVVAGYDLLARSVRDILDEAGMRVEVVRSVDAALAQLEQTCPHVLILDGHFVSNGEGLTLVERLRAAAPEVGMILLACRYDYLQVTAALQRGVDGYLYLGDRLARQLPEVVADVMAGEAYVSPTVVKMFAYQQQRRETVNQRLSAYQRDVLRLMTQHQNTAQIAARLGRTTKAIYQVQKCLREAFGARSNAELLSQAGALGFATMNG